MSLEENCDACRGDAVALGNWSDSMGTSHRCWIMSTFIRKDMGAGGRFYFFWTLGLIENDISRDQILGAEWLAGSVPKMIQLLP